MVVSIHDAVSYMSKNKMGKPPKHTEYQGWKKNKTHLFSKAAIKLIFKLFTEKKFMKDILNKMMNALSMTPTERWSHELT